MRDLNSLSGPWTGFSIQDDRRISETIDLAISGGKIEGSGSDVDGNFEIVGFYQNRNHVVMLTRRYTVTTEPSQLGVGVPYDYEGKWDGFMVSGYWHPRSDRSYGGPFEMWPLTEETLEELQINFGELELVSKIKKLVSAPNKLGNEP